VLPLNALFAVDSFPLFEYYHLLSLRDIWWSKF
jgi:hypothetical protein